MSYSNHALACMTRPCETANWFTVSDRPGPGASDLKRCTTPYSFCSLSIDYKNIQIWAKTAKRFKSYAQNSAAPTNLCPTDRHQCDWIELIGWVHAPHALSATVTFNPCVTVLRGLAWCPLLDSGWPRGGAWAQLPWANSQLKHVDCKNSVCECHPTYLPWWARGQ